MMKPDYCHIELKLTALMFLPKNLDSLWMFCTKLFTSWMFLTEKFDSSHLDSWMFLTERFDFLAKLLTSLMFLTERFYSWWMFCTKLLLTSFMFLTERFDSFGKATHIFNVSDKKVLLLVNVLYQTNYYSHL
jgi:hypothetical protein